MGKYVYNSRLSFIKPNFNGNRKSENRFTNYPYPDPEPTLKKVIKWKLSTNPQKEEKKKDTFKLQTHPLNQLPATPTRYLIWLGHASFLIRLENVTILIDPVVGGLPFIGRKAPFPIPVDELKGIDYILISHAHRDHFDVKSLNKILKNNPGAELLGPMRISSLFSELSMLPRHQEAAWFQQFEIKKDLKIVFVPAIHWHRRGLFDLNDILWGGFYINDGKTSIFHAGDTSYQKHFGNIVGAIGSIDLCLLPIGAYKPSFLMQGSHLNPEEAVKAFNQLGGKIMVPMHYGTFDLSDEPMGEPIQMIKNLQQNGLINGQLQLLEPGEIFPIP